MQKPFLTRSVKVGKIEIGGSNPIRTQSMLTTSVLDTNAALTQTLKLVDAGCELVRITIPGIQEALAVEKLKNQLLQKGLDIPLIADIHFFPKAALMVADFVEKVRVNPGNYLDKRATFQTRLYTDEQYQEEIEHLEEGFLPLLEKLKKQKKSLRLGVNHGSLSDRILSRYGNTVKGMIISAFEYAEVCRKYNFHDFLFSMKSSDPLIMLTAYRQTAKAMQEQGWDYPLHLGVTEAGEGEDGRVKSAVGIGALLLEGIGDTIRVSLTEEPEKEIRPAKLLVDYVDYVQKQKVSLSEASLKFTGDKEKITMEASAAYGYLYSKGLLKIKKEEEGIKINTDDLTGQEKTDLELSILQALKIKRSKAEFISCPGCGRTQFDIQSVTKKVKAKMSHLKSLKIAVMGCIVNGPGEMADADFGIIGSGKGKVDLYLQKKCIERGIDLLEAEEKLIKLIKKSGKWSDA